MAPAAVRDFFYTCSMIWKTDNWKWLTNLGVHLCTVGDNETLHANSRWKGVNCCFSFSFSGNEAIIFNEKKDYTNRT